MGCDDDNNPDANVVFHDARPVDAATSTADSPTSTTDAAVVHDAAVSADASPDA